MRVHEILDAKAAEIQKQLLAWVSEEDILKPGEKLVFSLRIEKVEPSVERDIGDHKHELVTLRISSISRSAYAGEFLKPAELTTEEIQEILLRMPNGELYEQLQELLDVHHNNPERMFFYSQHRPIANKRLAQPLSNGKYYRLAAGAEGTQLWEVHPKE